MFAQEKGEGVRREEKRDALGGGQGKDVGLEAVGLEKRVEKGEVFGKVGYICSCT